MKIATVTVALGAALFSLGVISTPVEAKEAEKSTTKKVEKSTEKEVKKEEKKEVIVTVAAGDSLSSIAEAHDTTYVRIFNANESIAHPDRINPGDKLRIPAAEEELEDRHGALMAQLAVVQPVAVARPTYSTPVAAQPVYRPAVAAAPRPAASSAGNTYVWGNCTWYAKNRRPDLPNMLGNGGAWTANAAAQGRATGSAPRAGAIAEIPGHVMYVESVNSNGTVNISEMNYNGGVGVVNHRTIPAGSARYIY